MPDNYFNKSIEELQEVSCILFDSISDQLMDNQNLHTLIEVERALVLREEQAKL